MKALKYKLWITECERLGLRKSLRNSQRKLRESLALNAFVTGKLKKKTDAQCREYSARLDERVELARTKQALWRLFKITERSKGCPGCASTRSATRRELWQILPSVEDLEIANEVHPIEIDGQTHSFCTTCQGVDPADNNLEPHQPTWRKLTGDGTGFKRLLGSKDFLK
jgi:hypothetical protein